MPADCIPPDMPGPQSPEAFQCTPPEILPGANAIARRLRGDAPTVVIVDDPHEVAGLGTLQRREEHNRRMNPPPSVEARQADATAAQPRPSQMVTQPPTMPPPMPQTVIADAEASTPRLPQMAAQQLERTRYPLAEWPVIPTWLETRRMPNLTSSTAPPNSPHRGTEGDLHECTATGAVWRFEHSHWVGLRAPVPDLIPPAYCCLRDEVRLREYVMLGVQTVVGRRIEFKVSRGIGESHWEVEASPTCARFRCWPDAIIKVRHEAIQLVRAGGMVTGCDGLPVEFADRINFDGRLLRENRSHPYPFSVVDRRREVRRDSGGNVVGYVSHDDDCTVEMRNVVEEMRDALGNVVAQTVRRVPNMVRFEQEYMGHWPETRHLTASEVRAREREMDGRHRSEYQRQSEDAMRAAVSAGLLPSGVRLPDGEPIRRDTILETVESEARTIQRDIMDATMLAAAGMTYGQAAAASVAPVVTEASVVAAASHLAARNAPPIKAADFWRRE